MGMYTVQQKVITWQSCDVEAESVDQAVELAVELDDWQGMVDVDEAVDIFWVESEGSADGNLYVYSPTGKLIKEQN